MNLIKEFLDGCQTDAPLVFKEAVIYHAIGYLPGRFINYKGRRPNVWFLLSSIPGAYRRSSVLKLHDIIRKNALLAYYDATVVIKPTKIVKVKEGTKTVEKEVEKTASEMREEKIKEVFLKTNIQELIKSGSPEGIIDKIVHSLKSNVKTFCINDSEFGLTLKNVSGAGYTSGIDTLYSQLYSGEEYLQDLSLRAEKSEHYNLRHIPAGTYVTMLCSMQEPKMYLRKESIGQGLMRRIILIYVTKEQASVSFENYRSILDMDNKQEELNMYYLGTKLGEMMLDYQRRRLEVELQDGFLNIIKRINYQVDTKAKADPCIENILKLSIPEHLYKLGIISAISRNQVEGNKLISTAEDINNALNFLNRALKNMDEVVEQVGIVDKPIEVDAGIEKVFRKIVREQKVNRSKLMQDIGLKKNKLDEILVHLLEIGRIKCETIQGVTWYLVK